MERRLERLCWGWQAALLGASILSSCFLLTQAQKDIPVKLEPPKQIEGQDVTLTPGGSSDFLSCNWYRKAIDERTQILTYFPPPNPVQQNHPSFTGRETAGPGCTLHIRNLALNYTGDYVVVKTGRTGSEKGQARIEVLDAGEKYYSLTTVTTDYAGEKYNSLTTVTTVSTESYVKSKAAVTGIVIGSLAGAPLIGVLLFHCLYRYGQRL